MIWLRKNVALLISITVWLVSFSFGYGMLNQQVQFNRQVSQANQINQQLMIDRLGELQLSIAKIEPQINNLNKLDDQITSLNIRVNELYIKVVGLETELSMIKDRIK